MLRFPSWNSALIECSAPNNATVPQTNSPCREAAPFFLISLHLFRKEACQRASLVPGQFFCSWTLRRKRKCYLWRTNLTQLRSGGVQGPGFGTRAVPTRLPASQTTKYAGKKPAAHSVRQAGRQKKPAAACSVHLQSNSLTTMKAAVQAFPAPPRQLHPAAWSHFDFHWQRHSSASKSGTTAHSLNTVTLRTFSDFPTHNKNYNHANLSLEMFYEKTERRR